MCPLIEIRSARLTWNNWGQSLSKTDRQTNSLTPYTEVCRFFLSVKFATSLTHFAYRGIIFYNFFTILFFDLKEYKCHFRFLSFGLGQKETKFPSDNIKEIVFKERERERERENERERDRERERCCIFRPVFGCCALQMLVKIVIFAFLLQKP